MKVCEICGDEIHTREGDNRCSKDRCQNAPDIELEPEPLPPPVFSVGAVFHNKKKRKRKLTQKEAIMESLGLVKVRGALGGVYWE